MEKTVKQIDEWFASECKQALSEIPRGIIDMATEKGEYMKVLAESIARKKGFKVDAVLKYLESIR